MTEPSPELVEEIARVISLAEIEATEQGVRPVDEHVFLARAVLSSPSIAKMIEKARVDGASQERSFWEKQLDDCGLAPIERSEIGESPVD